MKNGHIAGISSELLELRALLDHLRDEVAVALHAVGVNAFRKLTKEARDDPHRVCGNLRGARLRQNVRKQRDYQQTLLWAVEKVPEVPPILVLQYHSLYVRMDRQTTCAGGSVLHVLAS